MSEEEVPLSQRDQFAAAFATPFPKAWCPDPSSALSMRRGSWDDEVRRFVKTGIVFRRAPGDSSDVLLTQGLHLRRQ
jgi:hypothetical protein